MDFACLETVPNRTNFQGSGFFENAYATVEDGRVKLHGSFQQLVAVQASSAHRHLAVEKTDVPGIGTFPLPTPFNRGLVVKDQPQEATIGVLGRENRVDLMDDSIETSILYGGTNDDLENGDLAIRLGIGNCPPVSLPLNTPTSFHCLPELVFHTVAEAQVTFSIVDGLLSVDGTANGLASITALSQGGFLSLERSPNGDVLTDPFQGTPHNTLERPEAVGIRAPSRDDRVNINGTTRTSIAFAGEASRAQDDLLIRLRLDSCSFDVPLNAEILVSCNAGEPSAVKILNEQPSFFYTILDGEIALIGQFEDLTELAITSEHGLLRSTSELAPASALLSEELLSVVTDTPRELRIEAGQANLGVDLNGITKTGILYDGGDPVSNDLLVRVAIGDGEPLNVVFGPKLVPEPEPSCFVVCGVMMLLGQRRRRI